VITKISANSRIRVLLATLMILIAFEPFSPSSPLSADSFAAVFAYDPTTIQQEVSVSNINVTSQFTMTASVAKSWANDDVYIEALFKDASGNTITSVRNPSSGSTTLTSDSPVEMSVTLASTDADWSNSIAKVEVIVWSDDGEYWAGNYGVAVDWVKLEQTTTTGTSQLLLNPEFANGDSHWTSSAGWQTCSGGGGGAVCITNSYAPSTSSPTTSVAPATSSTTTTSTTSTSTTVPSSGSTTLAPSTTVGSSGNNSGSNNPGNSGRATSTTTPSGLGVNKATSTTSSTTTTTTVAPTAPDVTLGAAGVVVEGKTAATTVARADNTILVSGGGIEATIYGESSDGQRIDLDENGDLRLTISDKIVVEAKGFELASDVDVWMYSTPTRLGALEVAESGTGASSFTLPASIDEGEHRVVLDGANDDGQSVVLGLGIAVGALEGGSVNKALIIAPLTFAILIALLLPSVLRRRRKEVPV
jgi:hypothetical protein